MAKKRMTSISVDEETWRRFVQHCKKNGYIIWKRLTQILNAYLEKYENKG